MKKYFAPSNKKILKSYETTKIARPVKDTPLKQNNWYDQHAYISVVAVKISPFKDISVTTKSVE